MPSTVPDPASIAAESLLPHRGRMLLVDQVLAADDSQVTTLAVAKASWPLSQDQAVNPLVLIELVAQTAGIHNGLVSMRMHGRAQVNRGWLVGVKRAVFHLPAIVVGARITTTAHNAFVFEGLREISGEAVIEGRLAAEVTLQVMQAK